MGELCFMLDERNFKGPQVGGRRRKTIYFKLI